MRVSAAGGPKSAVASIGIGQTAMRRPISSILFQLLSMSVLCSFGTGNLALCLQKSRNCLLLMSNSSNAEPIFPYLISGVLGEICFPWYWDDYIPYDQPQWRAPEASRRAHPPCMHFHS